MATFSKASNSSGNQPIELNLTKEEVRVLHQALNEVCHGVDFSDSEFHTRMGTERSEAILLMQVLEHVYRLYD